MEDKTEVQSYKSTDSVPTTVELENVQDCKKYTINKRPGGRLEISKPLCILLALLALLITLIVALVVYFAISRDCDIVKKNGVFANEIDERLPRHVAPTNYRILLDPDLQKLKTSGAVTITLKTLEETNSIILNAKNLVIDQHSLSIKPLMPDSKTIKIKEQKYEDEDKYKIILDEPLKKDVQYELETKFTGTFGNHSEGLISNHYLDNAVNDRQIVSTQLSPMGARRLFPCFDEPSLKATFTIHISRNNNMVTISNTPVQHKVISLEKENKYWDEYYETPNMSTYSVAFIVSNNIRTKSPENATIKVWSRDDYVGYTDFATTATPKILEYFENYLDIKFPLPKVDLVALPDLGFDAMENWGLITFREDKLLYDKDEPAGNTKGDIALLLAREIALQWFGDLVTPKWWDDLWVKEGLANYFQYKGASQVEPVGEYPLSETGKAMEVDALESSRPISTPVKNRRQIWQIHDEITSSKGGSLIRMINHFLGEDTFRRGLTNFINSYKNKNADRQDFFTHLTEAAHEMGTLPQTESLNAIMKDWTEKPGFPVITAVAEYKHNKLHISQKRFYLNGKEEESSWWVPVSFTTSTEANFTDSTPKFWLKGEQKITKDIEFDEWFLLNINQTGYYIVNYDERNWQALTENVMALPDVTRAQLISDSMDLAKANLLAYDIPLKLIARVAAQDKNITSIPILTALRKLKYLSDILSATSAFGDFDAYHTGIFREIYFEAENKMIGSRKKSEVLEWACRNPETSCAQNSMAQFRNMIAHGQRVDPEVSSIIYCLAIRDGDESNWNHINNKYKYSRSPVERPTLLDALGCTKQTWLLSKLCNRLLNDTEIKAHEAVRIFKSVAKNPVGTPVAFDFLRRNWNQLLERYGDGFNILADMVKSLVINMNTQFQLSEFQRFRDTLKTNVSTAAYAMDITIDTIKVNVDWTNKNYNFVKNWLKEYRQHFSSMRK